MKTKDDWKYVARTMRSKGFSIGSIVSTLENLGHVIPKRTLYDNLRGIFPDPPWVELGFPLTEWEVATYILECEIPRVSDIELEGVSSIPAVFDLGIPDLADLPREQWIYYPTSANGSGLKTYLHRCNRENRRETQVDATWLT